MTIISLCWVNNTCRNLHPTVNLWPNGGGFTTDAEGNIFLGGGIGVNDNDNIYVSDRGLHRVQKFDSDGNFQRTWGRGVDDGSPIFQNGNLTPIHGCPLNRCVLKAFIAAKCPIVALLG